MKEHPKATDNGSRLSRSSNALEGAALDYVEKLRESNPQFERPQVTLLKKETGQCHPMEGIKKIARKELKKSRQAEKVANQGTSHTMEQVQPTTRTNEADLRTAELSASSASSLPPRDSPLTKVFLGQYLSLLVQETIASRNARYCDLAREMSISEIVLQEAAQGNLPMTRGRWVRFSQLIGLSTTFEVRASERNGTPCWELCYPPIHVGQPMQWW